MPHGPPGGVCVGVCVCLRQIGVYLKPSQMTGLAPKANQLGKWVKAPLIPVNITNQIPRYKFWVTGFQERVDHLALLCKVHTNWHVSRYIFHNLGTSWKHTYHKIS